MIQMEKMNFLDKLKSLKDVLSLWKCRGLSLAGRSLIFRSLMGSIEIIVCQHHEMPTQANA